MLCDYMTESADFEVWECDSGPYWVVQLKAGLLTMSTSDMCDTGFQRMYNVKGCTTSRAEMPSHVCTMYDAHCDMGYHL